MYAFSMRQLLLVLAPEKLPFRLLASLMLSRGEIGDGKEIGIVCSEKDELGVWKNWCWVRSGVW